MYTCSDCSYKSKTKICSMCNKKGFGKFKDKTYKELYDNIKLKDWILKSNYDCWGSFKRYARAINGEKYEDIENQKSQMLTSCDDFFSGL